ncbi:alpha beta-hydrolase [Trichoderma arundinaceum]|uniref:Alpha beta-hydrolase n=1 Tax=Trichoderma arundinaceum TaxID=490622 RepID=A0A395NNK5_TRIAR|nr:alpha beta-hydrolase [Trichoderma arundinaceum]
MATYENAPTQFLEQNGIKYAFRKFGAKSGTPLLYLIHFRGTMDTWDPSVIDPVAKSRPVILFDNAGVGHSSGEVPHTVRGMADHVAVFLKALKPGGPVDILGFSIGGYIAQMVALNHPELVRKLVIAGSGPSHGPQIQPLGDDIAATAIAPPSQEGFQALFFPYTPAGKAASQKFWKNANTRKGTPTDPRREWITGDGILGQGTALKKWNSEAPEGSDPLDGSFDRLGELKHTTLIVQGHTDVMVPTIGSFIMQQRMPNAQLIIYPDSGHGSIFQYADLFVGHLTQFLDE